MSDETGAYPEVAIPPLKRLIDRANWPPVVRDRDDDRWNLGDDGLYRIEGNPDNPDVGLTPELLELCGPLSLPGFTFWTAEPAKRELPPVLIDCDGDRWELGHSGETYSLRYRDGGTSSIWAAIPIDEILEAHGPLKTPDGKEWTP